MPQFWSPSITDLKIDAPILDSDIVLLPKTLAKLSTTLVADLLSRDVPMEDSSDSVLVRGLPPSLTSLLLECADILSFVDALPLALQHLSVKSKGRGMSSSDFAKLPNGLQRLEATGCEIDGSCITSLHFYFGL